MRLAIRLLLPTAFFVLALAPSVARADPLVVTSGSVSYSLARGAFRSGGGGVTGDGFHIIYGNPDGSSQNGLRRFCTVAPCVPGTVLNTSGSVIPDNLPRIIGSATIGSETYSIINVAGLMTFTGADVTIPALSSGPLVLSSPFTMSGEIAVFAFVDGSFRGVFSSQIVGSGTAFMTFIRSGDGYQLQSYRYVFADPSAVPEPATMLLLATGLAGVVARACKRRKA